jgi:putative nucleotide binding protein
MKTFVQNSHRTPSTPRKYNDYAFVLDIKTILETRIRKGVKDGIIITVIGEDHLTLLEVLGVPNSTFEVGERIFIGKEDRTKILRVLGVVDYDKISSSGQRKLREIFKKIILKKQPKIVEFFNNGKKFTPRQIEKLIRMIIIEKRDPSLGIIRDLSRVDW